MTSCTLSISSCKDWKSLLLLLHRESVGFQVKSDDQGVFRRHISGCCEGQVCASSERRHGFRRWEWSVRSYSVLSKCKDANLITDSRQFRGFASFCSAARQRQLKWWVFHYVCVTCLSLSLLARRLTFYTTSSVCVISGTIEKSLKLLRLKHAMFRISRGSR